MRLSLLALTLAAGLLACERGPQVTEVPPGSCTSSDMRTGDLPPPTPACAAAQGLPGDNLLCVDFDKLPSLSDSKLMGWDFEQAARGCWELLGGKLQVRSFSTFMGSCGFLLPPLSSADYQKYASFTLSIVQTLDINEAKQKVQLMLGTDDPVTRLVFQTTGIQPRQRNLFEVTKSALPNGGSGSYQPLFKLTSGAMVGSVNAGWQIESIAINGSL